MNETEKISKDYCFYSFLCHVYFLYDKSSIRMEAGNPCLLREFADIYIGQHLYIRGVKEENSLPDNGSSIYGMKL